LCARFTVPGGSNTYTYNPCKAFSLGGGCQDVAVSTLSAQLFVDETTPVMPSSSEHLTLYTVGHKIGASLFLSVTLSEINGF